MPVLTLFGRKTLFNGDDFRPPIRLLLLVKAFQFGLALFLVLLMFISSNWDDVGGRAEGCLGWENEFFLKNLSPLFVALYLILSNAVPLAEACIVWMPLRDVSGKGSPTETEQRKFVGPLCLFHLTFFPLIHIVVLGCGSSVIIGLQQLCSCQPQLQEVDIDGDSLSTNNIFLEVVPKESGTDRNSRKRCGEFEAVLAAILCILLISQSIDIFIVGIFYANLFCKQFKQLINYATSTGVEVVTRRRSQIDESAPSKMAGGFLHLMTVLNDYFTEHDSIDISPSDVKLGSAMTRLLHIHEYNQEIERLTASANSVKVTKDVECTTNPPIRRHKAAGTANIHSETDGDKLFRNSLSASNSDDRHLIAEGARFIWFAEAIYDWSGGVSAGCMGRVDNQRAHGKDPGKSANCSSATQEQQNSDPGSINSFSGTADFIFMQLEQGVEETPYAIVVDHAWKSIVVCIRGTSSIGDILADFMFFPEHMGPVGERCGFYGKDQFCHSGIFACTNWIYEDLNRSGILYKLLLGEEAQYKNYRLRITGHSLGGGCAAMLAVMLRPQFPDARCIAFSPPGCTMSKKLAEECSEYVTSFFLDTDMIPRFSMKNLNALRDQILEMVARVKIPKYQAFEFSDVDSKGPEALSEFLSASICASDRILPSPYYEQLQRSKIRAGRALIGSRGTSVDLFAPGEVIRLFRQATWDNDCSASNAESSTIESRIADNDEEGSKQGSETISSDCSLTARRVDREHLGIIYISETYFADHETANVKKALTLLGKACKLEEPYSSVLHSNDIV